MLISGVVSVLLKVRCAFTSLEVVWVVGVIYSQVRRDSRYYEAPCGAELKCNR